MNRVRRLVLIVVCGFTFLTYDGAIGKAQYDSYERPPIDYLNAEVHDPVARLAERIKSGETKLEFDPSFGYLQSVLKELDIPTSSQALVFSKTSLQLTRISPRRPRALYFNDDVYVGFCQRGDVLEFASTDSRQGATFYTLEQNDEDEPEFVRDRGGCLSCHASSRTQNVPGYLVRSVFADAAGRPKLGSGTFTTDQTSDFHDRWGGWYVTGQHGSMRHMGNAICADDEASFDRESGANEMDLSDRFNTDAYLTPHSDIVALMVLEHQTQMHNAIASANYETRQALHQSYQMNGLLERPEGFISDSAKRRIAASTERVLRHLLMCEEFVLTDSVSGSTSFAEDFEARGPVDGHGRSLRELNLQTRLFEYPCSYLIYSDAFAGLPDEVRSPILSQLIEILVAEEVPDEYAHLSKPTRTAILSILRDTLPEVQQMILASNNAN
ncbi:hypothetical protein [Rhodopirellula sallentina]|uniref:Uncharacterized protein n=1 Tax=Rhodopirellula sallentina SM41 TaxID=1263870 RepID=M5TST2_9BACT|nr:hypothetical protein [Rhodopirellula sallentina]EMI52205.1 hypothetical protein RSSM_06319 [Rhodopirellula sallentina SM41]